MYYILDSHTHEMMPKEAYKTRALANRFADKLNLAYGASRYYVVFSLSEPRS